METSHAGLDVVKFIREERNDKNMRILLRTGQAGQFPEETVFEQYDINNFLEKADLTSRRLKTALKVALRTYRDMIELDDARKKERELRQAADAANQAKSNFLHMMSHELRTPLQGTKGPFEEFKHQFHLFSGVKKLQTLIDELDDDGVKSQFSAALIDTREEVAEIAGQGLDSVVHLLGIIEDVLDFARIEAGKLSLSIATLSIAKPVDEVIRIVRPLAEKQGLALTVTVIEDLTVQADLKRMKQILLNLLGNAIKFTSQGTVSLDISRQENQALFQVKDTGPGIPEEKIETIFNAFEQVDNSSTRQAEGTGLGLPITQELVHRQGGEIKVQSVMGKGCVFSFTLPLAKDKQDSQE
jgi:signal transduction histidine kinase